MVMAQWNCQLLQCRFYQLDCQIGGRALGCCRRHRSQCQPNKVRPHHLLLVLWRLKYRILSQGQEALLPDLCVLMQIYGVKFHHLLLATGTEFSSVPNVTYGYVRIAPAGAQMVVPP